MATMYSLFLGFLFTAVCSVNGNGSSVLVFSAHSHPSSRLEHSGIERSKSFTGINYNSFLCRSVAAAGPVPFLLTEKEPKGQGLVARLNYLLISGNKITEGWKPSSAKLNSLRSNKSYCLPEIIDNSSRLAQPRPYYSVIARSSLQLLNLSPTKFLTIVGGCTSFVSKVLSDEFFASFFAENDEVLIHSFESKKSLDKKEEPCHGSSGVEAKHSNMEDNNTNKKSRQSIIVIASKELGTREATGNNDGPRIEEYLRYTSLGKGYDWCAAFVSWVYGQAGLDVPRNPWSPALFPKARQISKDQCRSADIFGIYGSAVKRINHVGLIRKKQGEYLITIEGNSNNRVESRRRHLKTVYAIADWVNE